MFVIDTHTRVILRLTPKSLTNPGDSDNLIGSTGVLHNPTMKRHSESIRCSFTTIPYYTRAHRSHMLCPDCFAQQTRTAEHSKTFFFTIGLNHCIEKSTQKPSYYKLYHKNSTARTILTSRSLENLSRVIATLSLFLPLAACLYFAVSRVSLFLPLAARPALMQRLDTVPYQVPYRLHDCCKRTLPYR